MGWDVTTVADDEIVAFDGADVLHLIGLEPDTEYELADGVLARTLPRPPGERLATIATVNDVHFGEVECGILDGWGDPVLRAEPGEEPYPEMMNRAAIAEIAALDPDLVVVKGDLTADGTQEQYDAFLDCYGVFGDRLLHVQGNHESHPGSRFKDDPVQMREVPGARVVLFDTSRPGREGGGFSGEQADALDAYAAGADGPVLAMGHHHLFDESFGIGTADSERLVEVIGRQPAILGWFAGHTHRNRVHHYPPTGGVPFAEVSCVKDYPGAWAEYRIFEGGMLQVFRRISAPEALTWTEKTKVMFSGLYKDYAFGTLADRCFAIASRSTASSASAG